MEFNGGARSEWIWTVWNFAAKYSEMDLRVPFTQFNVEETCKPVVTMSLRKSSPSPFFLLQDSHLLFSFCNCVNNIYRENNRKLFYFILFYFYFILFYFILFYFILFYFDILKWKKLENWNSFFTKKKKCLKIMLNYSKCL